MGSACWQFFQNLRMLLDGCADGCACGLAVQEAKQAKRQVQQTRWPNAMALGRGSRWLALGRARLLLLAPRGSSTRLEPAEPRWKLAKRRKLAYSALHAHGEPVQNRKAFRAHVLHSRPPAAERKHESHAAVVWRCNSPLLQQRHQQRTALFLCVCVCACDHASVRSKQKAEAAVEAVGPSLTSVFLDRDRHPWIGYFPMGNRSSASTCALLRSSVSPASGGAQLSSCDDTLALAPILLLSAP